MIEKLKNKNYANSDRQLLLQGKRSPRLSDLDSCSELNYYNQNVGNKKDE